MTLFGAVTGLLMGPLLASPSSAVAAAVESDPLKVAIFVDNRAGADFDSKVPVLEDFLAGQISSRNMKVLSREIILDALKNFSAGSSTTDDTPGQVLDRVLSDNTSALRLAQNLGADYILMPIIATYGKDTRSYTGQGVRTVNEAHTLRVSYRLAEAARGGEVGGDRVTVTRTLRQSDGLQVESSDIVNGLLDSAADRLTQSLVARRATLPSVSSEMERVKVTLQCTIADFAKLPNAGLNESNEVVLGEGHATAYAMNVNAEVNGITIGSASGTMEVPAGLNRLRLTREGFAPFERMVNFYDGQTLTVTMQMSEAGYARWKDVVTTLTALENNRKLTDAEVEVLRGYAQMLHQSGIKVDTQEGVNFYHGLYGWPWPTPPPR